VLLAEVAVTESPLGQLAAVWENVASTTAEAGSWSLLEQELWLRAARDPEVADVLRVRNAEARRSTARRLAGWSSSVEARPVASPEESAVLVKALLTGLAMQRRLEPGSVGDDLAVRGLAALLGAPEGRRDRGSTRPGPSTRSRRSGHTPPTATHSTTEGVSS